MREKNVLDIGNFCRRVSIQFPTLNQFYEALVAGTMTMSPCTDRYADVDDLLNICKYMHQGSSQ